MRKYYLKKLEKLHEKAVKLIDCNKRKRLESNVESLKLIYSLNSPKRNEHHYAIMYRLSKQRRVVAEYISRILGNAVETRLTFRANKKTF